jgi:hypothetical protein
MILYTFSATGLMFSIAFSAAGFMVSAYSTVFVNAD